MKQKVARDIRQIFNASTGDEAKRQLQEKMKKYEQTAPKLADWMETAIPEGLTIFAFPEKYRKRIRTNNMTERLNREIKHRTRVVGIFPNEASCLRLVASIVMEVSEEWLLAKHYLSVIE